MQQVGIVLDKFSEAVHDFLITLVKGKLLFLNLNILFNSLFLFFIIGLNFDSMILFCLLFCIIRILFKELIKGQWETFELSIVPENLQKSQNNLRTQHGPTYVQIFEIVRLLHKANQLRKRFLTLMSIDNCKSFQLRSFLKGYQHFLDKIWMNLAVY